MTRSTGTQQPQKERIVEPDEVFTVLLAGDAGLRTGEIIALDWTDIDFKRGLITVSKSEWNGQVTLPKGGRARRLPMTKKLAAVLQAHRHLGGPRVLYRDNGASTSKQTLSTWMISARQGSRRPGTSTC